MFGITFHDQLFGSWDQAKGYLVEELQQLHAVLDRRVGSFLANTSPGAIVIGAPGGNEWTALPIGAADTVLRSDGTAPSWQKVVLSTDVTGTLGVTHGGTGLAIYAVGDIIYASTTTVLSRLADVATGNALISGGVGVAPLWGKIGLTTHVSGDLPFASFVPATAASRLVGRGSASGAGDFEEITLGAGISMTGTVLSASGTGVAGFTYTNGAASTTWTIVHNLGTLQLAITCTDNAGLVIIPDTITYTDVNTITVTWTANQDGFAYIVG